MHAFLCTKQCNLFDFGNAWFLVICGHICCGNLAVCDCFAYWLSLYNKSAFPLELFEVDAGLTVLYCAYFIDCI